MEPRIKALYDEANRLYKQGKDILTEYEGKELPQDKLNEVNTLFDQSMKKSQEAQTMERDAKMGASFAEPQNRLGAGAVGEGAGIQKADSGQIERKAAFVAYLRKGRGELSSEEQKALAVAEDTAGGYLVQDTFRNELLRKAKELTAMRRLARVLPPVAAGSVITPTQDERMSDAEWTTEIRTGSNDTVKPFGRRALKPHPLAKRVKVSNAILRAPGFDPESWVRDEMADAFARPEEYAFLNGDGADKPLGLLRTPNLPTYTTAGSNTVTADDVINWVYRLKGAYAANSHILCNQAFIRKIRLMKVSAEGNYIWQPGLQAGSPARILDVPYELSDYFDDGLDNNDAWEDNAVIAVRGDFKRYWIVDGQDLAIQRLTELYAESNETGFIGRKEGDGMAVLAEAFIALKVKA